MINTSVLKPEQLRAQFPALQLEVNGKTAVFLDGPGGTQSPQSVIDAISGYMAYGNSNLGGQFLTSKHAMNTVASARLAMADLLNANSPDEISFGQNMTSLTFSFSRALARTWQAGDEIIVTRMDHDANISPWLMAAEDRGVTVRWLDFDPANGALKLDELPQLLNDKTRLLAITAASNAIGSITDLETAVTLAHNNNTPVFVDAVHYAPHGPVDVQAWDCDFLVCSVYKFFGPHTGVLYGKHEQMERLTAYKVRPAPAQAPGKWETGTQSFESLAGVTATVNYLAAIGGEEGERRERVHRAMQQTKAYEMMLSERFLRGATAVPGLKIYGIADIERLAERTPTFGVTLAGYTPTEVAAKLGEQGIFVGDGHYYAIAVAERLGLLDKGNLVRIGFVHYNTPDEVDRVLAVLTKLTERPS
ncbi:MAG: cysteine desulfurase-like protein [Chloroflexi bacterium]|nr:cysteine desulfurase-like protein [Chloroflexota bacterium]